MRKLIIYLLLITPVVCSAQGLGIGLKAGYNFANVTNASSINNSNRAGYLFGIFLAPQTKGIITSRHEFIYSRQGYNFDNGTTTGNVNLDYIIIPQMLGINITKFVQLQLGMQLAYLLNAKADSTNKSGGSTGSYSSVMSYYNPFDYGFGAGVELHPVLGLLIGARYNISLNNMYKGLQTGQQPSFSSVDAKNNVVQVFAGWIFGKKSKSKKKNQSPSQPNQ
jgi:hypothetical protein